MLDGKKVTIQIDKLLETHHSVKFENFLNNHRDKIFTAQKIFKYKSFYVLKEDESNPKWIFFEDDLVEVK